MGVERERDLQRAILCGRTAELVDGELVTDCPGDCLAHLAGWHGMHVRAAGTGKGWRTPTSGDLARGWPDLVLVGRGRLVFAELKAGRGRLTDYQAATLQLLADAAGAECYVWRFAQLDDGTIWRVLHGRGDAELVAARGARRALADR